VIKTIQKIGSILLISIIDGAMFEKKTTPKVTLTLLNKKMEVSSEILKELTCNTLDKFREDTLRNNFKQ